jgi:hypothetical protein
LRFKCASEWNGLAIVKNQRKIIYCGILLFFPPELPMPVPTLTSSLPPLIKEEKTLKKRKRRKGKNQNSFFL